MLIRFKRDFQSARTDEQFYRAGATADLEDYAALIAEGVAELVTIEARTGQVKPPETPPARRQRGARG